MKIKMFVIEKDFTLRRKKYIFKVYTSSKIMTTTTMICTICQQNLELSNFSKDKSRLSGFDTTCKACKKIQRNNRINKTKNVPESKVCNCCGESKTSDNFYIKNDCDEGLHSECNSCKKDKRIDKKEENMLKILPNKYEKVCGNCKIQKPKKEFNCQIYSTDGIDTFCRICSHARSLVWRLNNPNKVREYRSREYFKNYKIRRETNSHIKLAGNIRNRVRMALKRTDSAKYHNTYDLIDCKPSELHDWLEWQFDEKMTWDNYGSYWHVDHVTPCSFYDLDKQEEQLLCFNWRNCRPLCAKKNISKNDSIQPFQILLQEIKVNYYEQHFQIAGIP
jgi:hypothetical protein